MFVNPTKLIFFFIATNGFLSCDGQANSDRLQTETKTLGIGQIVSIVDNQIWAILQDKKGEYWFGSNGNGIYCYNGKELIQYSTKDGLVDDQIRGIQEDNEGNIYIETPEGISKFDGLAFHTLEVTRSTDNQWTLEPNDLWFGYNANDVYRYDGTSLFELKLPRKDLKKAFGRDVGGVLFDRDNNDPYSVYGVDKDNNGHVWFGTVNAGAFRFDGSSFIWFNEKELFALPDGRVPGVRSMIQDKDGYFWLSNFYSKYRINSKLPKGYQKMKAVDLPKAMVGDKILYFNSGLTDQEGNLWMTTYSGGVWKYDGKVLSNFEINNGNENVLLICIAQDNMGTIWLGTNNDGVYRKNGNNFVKFELNR